MSEEWVSVLDEKTGQTYIFNASTGETKWLWSKSKDEKTGDVVFRNALTGDIKAEDQVGGKLANQKEDELRKKHKLTEDEGLYTNKEGRIYAYNSKTGKSRWLTAMPKSTKRKASASKAVARIAAVVRTYLINRQLLNFSEALIGIDELRKAYDIEKLSAAMDSLKTGSANSKERKEVQTKLIAMSEMITQALLKVDGVEAGNNHLIRHRRRKAVAKLLKYADETDELKTKLKETAK
uniref:BAG domain-containing protein n=1 Tax=Rhodosorus marinus TaxID=101924 RepID=A0A7S3ENH8_9RHOD|mmetsp:Transcript_478/g.818  ORF Transcript_478/g.818 Transcript_478/m.818 type:complete len:237 (+) Transcript_478:1313-2023(+)|eukprot:CAMPEP_0113963416 /NCGR_PEP_ID=MMETSP0011_2-20120614/6499_1 /TAXON_ID=101924 /ORGANISM="Rhodosorus marinus" /LENGTH=236 /DNA_ID=CAMNT_0000975459 /DNA_START=200 /DNA_END=910 /DNA_ORIENTATION=- /assembly_acc=CAM_ASM_000156